MDREKYNDYLDEDERWVEIPGIPAWLSIIFCGVLFLVLIALIFKG